LVPFPRSSNNLQQKQTVLHPQLNVVVVGHQQLASLQDQRKQKKEQGFW
jgi:hypothetical protein